MGSKMNIIFWCEFPKDVDFVKLNKLIDFNTEIYFAISSLREFNSIKKRIRNKRIEIGAWPILKRKEGYWFSGFSDKKNIDKLDEINKLKVKIDIEPPIYKGKHSLIKDFFWIAKNILIKGKNNNYLKERADKLNFEPIFSGFLLPRFLRTRYGDDFYNGKKNYMCYTTFVPRIFRGILRFILINIVKGMSKNNYYAIGLLNNGIFGNEPEYENINEFKKDIEMMKRAGVRNLCIYSIEGILKREDAKKWLRTIKSN